MCLLNLTMMVESSWWHMIINTIIWWKKIPLIWWEVHYCYLVVSSFWCYIFDSPFTLVTYHQSLKFLMALDCLTWKLARWAFILQEYDFDIVHRVDRVNQNIDELDRNPNSSEENTIGAYWRNDVNLQVILGWHISTYLCILLGVFWKCTSN